MIIIDKNYTGNIYELMQEALNLEIFLVVTKPKEWTSFDVVAKIRNTIRVKKIGHAGTLDPLATGVLVLAIGKATKKIDQVQATNKNYIATIKLGATTKTFDLESDEENLQEINFIDLNLLQTNIKTFEGNIKQIPPLYSAKKINGKRMYFYARKNEEIEIPEIEVNIHKIDIIDFTSPYVKLDINCSKGTYIRTIASDLGKKLGCGAYLAGLERNAVGEFYIENAIDLEDFITRYRYDYSVKA